MWDLSFCFIPIKTTKALVPNNSRVEGSDTAIIVAPFDGYQVAALRQA